MKIVKAINNNVVSAIDDEGIEVVLMGTGIGFKAKEGHEVKEEQIEKIFKMNSKTSFNKFKELLVALPLEHIQISNQIIEYAKKTLGKRLNQNVYITLTDHINFAVERYTKGMNFPNPLLWEVKSFYPSEYLIGEYSVRLIKEKLNIDLTEDEAASIAIHIVNAEYNTALSEAMNIMVMIRDILKIVEDFFKKKLDEQSLSYSIFVTHLKFLAQRAYSTEQFDSNDMKFMEIITTTYPEDYICSQKIAEYIKEKYGQSIATEELLYLTIHIKRIRSATK